MQKNKQFNNKSLTFVLITMAALIISFINFPSSVSASSLYPEDVEFSETLVLDINYIDGVGLSEEEIQEELQKQTERIASKLNSDSFSTFAATPTNLSASIVRISGSVHQLYLNYSGSATINSFRIRNLTISNTSNLFPTQYHSESYIFKNTTGQASGSQYLATFNAPTSTKKFKVEMGSLEGYYHAYGWRFGLLLGNVVTVR